MFPQIRTQMLRLGIRLTLACALFALLPASALAAEVQTGNTVTIDANQTVNDDLYAFGSNVAVHGDVNGDVIAAGTSVTIDGHVTGSVMAAGSTVNVNGPVDGSVRLAGTLVTVAAPVQGDILMGGSAVSLDAGGRAGRDVLAGGNAMNVQGPVARNVTAGGGTLSLGSSVGGAVRANVDHLVLADGASIAGPIVYVSTNQASVAPSARLAGEVQHGLPVEPGNPWVLGGIDTLAALQGFVGLALFGMLFILAFPRAAAATTNTVRKSWATSLGVGFAALVCLPVLAAFVFGFGLIIGGWWIGVMLLGSYALLLALGYVAFGEWLGLTVIRSAGGQVHQVWALLLGLVILSILAVVPVVNVLVILAATLFGVGALVVSGWRAYLRTRATTSPPVAQPEATQLPPTEAPTRLSAAA